MPVLGGGVKEREVCADADGSISERSFDAVSSAVRDEYKGHSKMMKLNPGERQGWWSAMKFDRRIRMRALVQGAVNDHRTRILLDTGANVSVITDTFAKKLRLRDIPDQGQSIGIQGITEGKVSTTRRALVKITLELKTVYEFEMWVMAHSAGVDVDLGTDFIIPAGIRLDLFRGAAQLLNEVCIPLIKTNNMVDSMECTRQCWTDQTFRHTWPRVSRVSTSETSGETGSARTVAFDTLAMLVLVLDSPRGEGYVHLDSKKFED
ncbi:hypothetical protein L915_03294 [Phytophthora nicotianae]|uniref:Peptidase A2 domain-containing protein n=1 Tax=Phytophthora nicotianae TaxID=4792 RepID=W2HEJ7_PHYNI|nr:hypothetical protein L915_03294 [Phytophthora nicotianae]